jgi:thioredoxin-related protein
MQLITLLFAFLFAGALPAWRHDLKQAEADARKDHKLILLNFSGSDWCGPCIRMEKEIFENEQFQAYATRHLVLVNADFPRLKKNQLEKQQVALNEQLAEQYNKTGTFPLTLLLDAEGKVIKKWEGFPAKEAQSFIAQLQTLSK